jgi:hypothetical protein
VETGFRRSYDSLSSLSLGSQFSLASHALSFGDGTSWNIVFTVAALSPGSDWILGRGNVTKTYNATLAASGTTWVAFCSFTARLTTSNNNFNNKAMRFETNVFFTDPNVLGSPISGAFPTMV